jgi:hypothetical protein
MCFDSFSRFRARSFLSAPAPARSRFGTVICLTEAVLLVDSVGLLSFPDPAGSASFDFCHQNFLHPLSRFCAPGVPLDSLAAQARQPARPVDFSFFLPRSVFPTGADVFISAAKSSFP